MAARWTRWRKGCCRSHLGEATKLAGRMLDASKIYEFTVQFGEETSTLDSEGEIVTTQRPPPADAGSGGDPASISLAKSNRFRRPIPRSRWMASAHTTGRGRARMSN